MSAFPVKRGIKKTKSRLGKYPEKEMQNVENTKY